LRQVEYFQCFFTVLTLALLLIFLNIFPFHFTENTVPIFCVEPEPEAEPEPSPGAGALIKSEAPKKAPDGPKMGGSREKAPAPEHWLNLTRLYCF
jgi:hypothetical protein